MRGTAYGWTAAIGKVSGFARIGISVTGCGELTLSSGACAERKRLDR